MAANRITLNHTISIAGADGIASLPGSESIDQVGTHFIENTQDCTAGSWEAINMGDIATLGYLAVKNLDATNYIEIATANDGTGILTKVLAGKSMPPIAAQPGATYYVRANTALVKIRYLAIET